MKLKAQSLSKIKSKNNSDQIQTLDGPPLDFSFKNIRTLQQLISVVSKNPEISQEGSQHVAQNITKQTFNTFNLLEDDNLEISKPKLQIIRKIDITTLKVPDKKKQNTIIKQGNQTKLAKTFISRKTTTLFLRYNKLKSIEKFKYFVQKIFPHPNQLMWVDLSHNRLTTIVEDFGYFPIKNLYLHANYISSFSEIQKLQKVKLLKILTIHANPLQNYNQFRIIISSLLPQVQKIDSTLLTKRQRQRSQILMKSLKKLPVVPAKNPPNDSDAQQQD